MRRLSLFFLLGLVYLLHEDAWLWAVLPVSGSDRLWFGLPAVLLYHVAYCFVVAGVMALLIHFAWPQAALDVLERAEEPDAEAPQLSMGKRS